MSPSKMTILTGVTTLLGALAVGAQADSASTVGESTEIAQPQEIGTVTASGSLVYSMSICTTVHHTICQVTLSTGGPAPSDDAPSALGYPSTTVGIPGSYGSMSQDIPASGDSSTAPGEQPVSTLVTTDEVTTTAVATTTEVTMPSTTGTGDKTASMTTAAGPTTTGAASGLNVVPAAILGVVGMAMAVLV